MSQTKDKSFSWQVWGALTQTVSTVAKTVSDTESSIYSSVQAAVTLLVTRRVLLPMSYYAILPCPVPPQSMSSCCLGKDM